ncbi:MAG TPA: hypothetical protein VFY59_00780 [Rubrobacter sp.]|nr:hypothetical protein [Rubrobacter sp.]
MRRMIKALAMATLVATILVASTSPALARVVRGGVLLHTERPCHATLVAQNAPGSHILLNPEDRTPGCWVELPPGANHDL